MKISTSVINSLVLSNNVANINDITYRKLIENCMSVLCNNPEVHNTSSLYNSKGDIVKQVYAALLTVAAEFARNNLNKQEVSKFLCDTCSYTTNRADIFADCYEKSKLNLQLSLGNIGTHLPHVTGVDWKINYIIKSSNVDQTEGPLFRIALTTETFDQLTELNAPKQINFVCNGQELQELVYKLRDAVKHCQRIASEH